MTKNQKNVVEVSKSELPTISKAEIEAIKKADMLNKAKAINKTAKSVNSYNYEKIAKDIEFFNTLFNLQLSESECNEIKANVSLFVNEKTKVQFSTNKMFSTVKKNIRKYMQNAKNNTDFDKAFYAELLTFVK